MLVLSIVIGIIFGFFAGLMAFIIMWHEYERYKFTSKRLFKESFQSAIFTFVVFLILSFIIGFVLKYFVINK